MNNKNQLKKVRGHSPHCVDIMGNAVAKAGYISTAFRCSIYMLDEGSCKIREKKNIAFALGLNCRASFLFPVSINTWHLLLHMVERLRVGVEVKTHCPCFQQGTNL